MEIEPQKLDWRAILQDLKDKGHSLYKIAKILGKSETTVQGWYHQGKEPSHSNGAAILSLHSAVCGQDATQKRCAPEVVYMKEATPA